MRGMVSWWYCQNGPKECVARGCLVVRIRQSFYDFDRILRFFQIRYGTGETVCREDDVMRN